MTCHLRHARILAAACLLAALIASPVARGQDASLVAYDGPDDGLWGDDANWVLDEFGEPLADFAERAVINTNVTVIVNQAFNTPITDTGGVLLGVTGNTGELLVQNGGNLNIRVSDVHLGRQTNGTIELGRASRGFLIVQGGGTLTAERILQGGPAGTLANPESKITLGSPGALTATLTSNGQTSLRRTTQVTGPNVAFTSKGALTMSNTHTLIADITGGTHSSIKVPVSPATPTTGATGHAYVDGRLAVQFTGVVPALGSSWNLIDANTIHGNFSSIDATHVSAALPAGKAFQTRIQNGGVNGKQLQVVVEQMLTLQLNRQTGVASIRNTSGVAGGLNDVGITGYQVESKYGSLSGAAWNSLTDQAVAGWQETTPNGNSVGELKSTAGGTVVAGNTSRPLGDIFSQVFPAFGTDPDDDISFSYTTADGVRQGLIDLQGTKVFNDLIVRVDPTTGQAQLRNDSPHTIKIEGYSIFSPTNQLLTGTWNSLDDQNVHPNVVEAAPTAGVLSELVTAGTIELSGFETYSLGTIHPVAGTQNLTFEFLMENAGDSQDGQVSYGPLDVIAPPSDADFDNDSDVDGGDFLIWQRNLGVGNSNATGDADSSGTVTAADLAIWKSKFGGPPATPAAGAVPEPSSMLLAVLAGGLFWRRSRSRDAEATAPTRAITGNPQRSNDMARSHARTGIVSAIAGLLAFSALTVGSRSSQAADILLVTRPAQFGAADDQLIALLKSFGHTIVNEADIPLNQADYTDAAPTAAELVGVDAIVLSRNLNSGDYTTNAAETTSWNAITTPIVSMNPQLARGGHATLANNRFGWVNMEATATTDNTAAATDYDAFPNPAHAFVNGRGTDMFFLGETIDYLNRDSTKFPATAITVANMTIGGTPFAAIVDIPAGSTLFANAQSTTPDPLLGRRVLVQMIEYPDTHDVFSVTTNGGQILNQIITSVSATGSTAPGDVNGDTFINIADFNLIKANFGTTVDNRNQGDLTGDSFVDLADYRLWKAVAAPADIAAAVIPEPTGLALALAGVASIAALRRRRVDPR